MGPRPQIDRAANSVVEEGSANVYADLGYGNAPSMRRKSRLVAETPRVMELRQLSPRDDAQVIGIDPVDFSCILRGPESTLLGIMVTALNIAA